MSTKRSAEHQQVVLERRRSNASSKHVSNVPKRQRTRQAAKAAAFKDHQ